MTNHEPADRMSGTRLTALSVVIPVYNEQTWIRQSVTALLEAADRADIEVDVVVVDDGSTDDTLAVIDEIAAGGRVRRISQTNSGRMAARVTGVAAARYPQVLLLDARVVVGSLSLRWLVDTWPAHPEASVWCGHIEVQTQDNPVAAFWSGLTRIGWHKYMSNPRLVSFGGDDFDQFPKGTGALVIERDYFLRLARSFESLYDVQSLASDDTRLLRRAAAERRIWLAPDFRFDYHGKTGTGGLRRQSYFRGTTFVDSYLGQSQVLGAALIGATVVGAALAALAVLKPVVGLPVVAVAWVTVPSAVAISGGTRREIFAAAAMTPPFVAFFGAGVLRGYALAARARLRASQSQAS